MFKLEFPEAVGKRGVGFWLRPANLLAARRKLRRDFSADWRSNLQGVVNPQNPKRSVSFDRLVTTRRVEDGFKFLILADTGEGDYSQYGLLPLIRFLKPDFMIINGDTAYPAGSAEDFEEGFFKPYQNLGIPIWAVPGNHEYYSPECCREFYDVFCTLAHARKWEDYGLRLVPQPGLNWELRGPEGMPLVVLGVDSGMKGNLDGKGLCARPDDDQLRWLCERLEESQAAGLKVIILFHIPALVRGNADVKEMTSLHRVISSYPCVRLVACGHEHNYQRYTKEEFARFVAEECGARAPLPAQPEYIVCGGGGAYLQQTTFPEGTYAVAYKYPTEEEWRSHVKTGRRVVDKVGLAKWPIGLLAAMFDKASLSDDDKPKFLSFLQVEVKPVPGPSAAQMEVEVTPVFMDNLVKLYGDPPPDIVARVDDPNPRLEAAQVAQCLQTSSRIVL